MDVLKKTLVCFTILSILILVCGCVNTQGNVQMPVKDVEKSENKKMLVNVSQKIKNKKNKLKKEYKKWKLKKL